LAPLKQADALPPSSIARRRWLQSAVVTSLSWPFAVGCSKAPEAKAPVAEALPRGDRIDFDYPSLDDRPTDSASTQGRVTVVLFLTTYGDPSILAARFLTKVFREHTPRFNAIAVFLERVENRPLARIFRDSLALPFPSAMGSTDDIAGKGPFRGVDTVPSLVVLDRQGRETFRKIGVVPPDDLARILRGSE
jgi:hypothetical protein